MGADRDFSHVPLWRKLGIRMGSRVALVGAPAAAGHGLDAPGGLPDGVRLGTTAAAGTDVIVWFPADAAEVRAGIGALRDALTPSGGLWVAYPKKASRVPTDLDFDLVQRAGLDSGLVDNKSCAIDAVHTAVRFVRRRADR